MTDILVVSQRKDLILSMRTLLSSRKSYNRRSAGGDLGVRIQISVGIGNPTQNQAIDHLMIAKAIDKGFLDEDFFEDTDDRQELIRKINCYHSIRADVDTFTSKLRTMDPIDQRIIKPYLMRQKTMDELTEDMGIDYRSAIKRIYRIKDSCSAIALGIFQIRRLQTIRLPESGRATMQKKF